MPQIDITKATAANREQFANLFQFYFYDFSEMLGFSVREDGRFGLPDLDAFFAEPWRHVFLLRVDGELAGFAIVDEVGRSGPDAEDLINMDQFFVMRKFRGQGIGAWFAVQLFDRFRGRWRVSEVAQNPGARVFWRKVIGRYTGGNFIETAWQTETDNGTAQYFRNDSTEHQGVYMRTTVRLE